MEDAMSGRRKSRHSESEDEEEMMKSFPNQDRRERRRALKRKRASTIMAIVKCLLKDSHFDLDYSLSDDDFQTTSESDALEGLDGSDRRLYREVQSLKKRVRDLERSNKQLKDELQTVRDLNKAVHRLETIAERLNEVKVVNSPNYPNSQAVNSSPSYSQQGVNSSPSYSQTFTTPLSPPSFPVTTSSSNTSHVNSTHVNTSHASQVIPFPTIQSVTSMSSSASPSTKTLRSSTNSEGEIIELVPGSGIFLALHKFKNARIAASGKVFARTLLTNLFDLETLLVSTVRGIPPKGRGRESTPDGRPALNQDIINAIVERTVKEYPECSTRDVLSALSCKLVEMRRKDKELNITNNKLTIDID